MLQTSASCSIHASAPRRVGSAPSRCTCLQNRRNSTRRARNLCVSIARPDVSKPVESQGVSQTDVATGQPSRDQAESSQNGTRPLNSTSQQRCIMWCIESCAGVLEAKRALQFATAGTFRGGLITPTQRAVIEEAVVSTTSFCSTIAPEP